MSENLDHCARSIDRIEVRQPAGSIATFRAGKILRFDSYWSHETALKAVGLEE